MKPMDFAEEPFFLARAGQLRGSFHFDEMA